MNNDLISRKALLEKASLMEELDNDGIPVEVRAVSVDNIYDAPTVAAVPLEKVDELLTFISAICGFLPSCVGCEGKTEEGYRTEKCRYVIDSENYTDYIDNQMYCFKRGLDNYRSMRTELEELKKSEPVQHGRWKYYHKQNKAVCTNCSFERDLDTNFGRAVSCPNCGAKMDGKEGTDNA